MRGGAKVVLVGLVLAVAAACSSYGEDAGPTTTTTDGGGVEGGAIVGPEAGAADGGADAGDSGVGGLDCTGTLVCDDFERDGLVSFGWETLDVADVAAGSANARITDPEAPSPQRVFDVLVTGAPTSCAYEGLKATRTLEYRSVRYEFDVKVTSPASSGLAALAYVWFGKGGEGAELYLHLTDGGLYLYQQWSGSQTSSPLADVVAGYQKVSIAIDFVTRTIEASVGDIRKPVPLGPNIGSSMDFLVFGVGSFCSKAPVSARFDDVRLWAK